MGDDIVEYKVPPLRGREEIKNQLVQALNRDEIYCGDKAEFDKLLYDRVGTRLECNRKGYGSALYNATDYDIKKARERKRNDPPRLSKGDIVKIALRLSVPVENRERKEILHAIIEKLGIIERSL